MAGPIGWNRRDGDKVGDAVVRSYKHGKGHIFRSRSAQVVVLTVVNVRLGSLSRPSES